MVRITFCIHRAMYVCNVYAYMWQHEKLAIDELKNPLNWNLSIVDKNYTVKIITIYLILNLFDIIR